MPLFSLTVQVIRLKNVKTQSAYLIDLQSNTVSKGSITALRREINNVLTTVDKNELAVRGLVDFKTYFQAKLAKLTCFQAKMSL